MSTSNHAHEHDHHVTPPFTLFKTLIMLAIFMVLTIVAAKVDFGHIISSRIGLGSAGGSYINNFVALAIAITKASLVVGIFMGVKWGSKLVKLWAMTGFVWVVLLGITFGDYTSRAWENNRGWTPGSTDVAALPSQVDHGVIERQKEFEKHSKEEAEKNGTGGGH